MFEFDGMQCDDVVFLSKPEWVHRKICDGGCWKCRDHINPERERTALLQTAYGLWAKISAELA